MKLRTLLPALLLSLLTSACATAPEDADDVASGAGAIVACDSSDLQVELETVYLEDAHVTPKRPHKLPHAPFDLSDLNRPHKAPAGVIDPVVVTVDSPTLAQQADPGLDTAALCECADDACVVRWIDASMGCGVCAHVACDGGERGGCVPCVSIDEPPAESCVFADATVTAAE